ncbi:wall-associated receptor kinase 2-like [Cryptomeria japonica]|uniref:wall-associated receptor kinase 2-like n=1 Tax=Cryptomeria japonica TaxID=3369 RepID=UPI0027DA7375|nr:wall-associated receptor kinase 2-like [Cryptomeria japonica]
MHCGVVVRFVIWPYLVGFTAAAKCVPEKCGSMNVSYPFWINNENCGKHGKGFHMECKEDKDNGMMALSLPAHYNNKGMVSTRSYYKVWDIDYSGNIVINSSSLKANSCLASGGEDAFVVFRLALPFTISMSNRFVVVGCSTSGSYDYDDLGGQARCVAGCASQSYSPYCRYGSCEITLPDNYPWIKFTGGRLSNLSGNEKECGFSTILDPSTFRVVDNKTNLFWGEGRKADYGLHLNWGVGHQNCSTAQGTSNYSCSINADCLESPSGLGHVCRCLPGYEGNGYLNGTDCTATATQRKTEFRKTGNPFLPSKRETGLSRRVSVNYAWKHPREVFAIIWQDLTFVHVQRVTLETASQTGQGSVYAFVGASLAACAIAWLLRRRYLKHARDEYFRFNGGFLLERILAEKGKQTEGKFFKIFSENELKRASRDYSDDMKLGSGGSRTVYKGILSNGTTVAIKKFKEIPIGVEGEESVNQFINEIVILSGLNHKNVVCLVGCCLQTQSPVLVYEFVGGGTISQQLSCELDRPIIHRDVKSTNILLDNTVTPKVVDFGISRLLCGNDTHLTTNVMGICGYMDPEYFDTGSLTEKSDAYSFGDNCLTDILDPNVKNEENQDQVTVVASLARECLCPEGSGRPSMREVKMRLEEIGGSTTLTTSISCLNVPVDQISVACTQSGSINSLFQLTEMSRIHGR